jgi:hypothetical protein
MEKNTMKYAVVTTFHESGLKQYGQRMINTFCENWPAEVTLHVYPESCVPTIPDSSRVTVKNLEEVEELVAFKNRWRDVPKANGDVSADPVRSKRRDSGKGFKWNAVRFAHKVYAIFDCARITDADILIWMDADTICHSPIGMAKITQLIPEQHDICYLGRQGKFSECGLYSMNLRHKNTRKFLDEFQRVYDDAENGIFQMDEWHDSFVFDVVRSRIHKLHQLNWSANLADLRPRRGNSLGEGHPLINSEWGAYLDHLKGERKSLGTSKKEDLKVQRTEQYWQNLRA